MQAIFAAIFRALLSFIVGNAFGRKDKEKAALEDAVEDYREAEKIDAKPNLNNDDLRNWFGRLRK